MTRLRWAALMVVAVGCGREQATWTDGEAAGAGWTAERFDGLRAAVPAARPLLAVSTARHGSAIQIATLQGKRVLLVADAEARAVRMLDAASFAPVAEARLVGKPSQLVVAKDGRAYVTLRDANRLVGLEVDEDGLNVSVEVATPTEPFGVALANDDRTLLVTAGWGARLVAFTTGDLAARFEVPLGREPRGVAVAADGRAFVTHAVGSRVSRIDLSALAPGGVPPVKELSLAGSEVAQSSFCCGGTTSFVEPRRAAQGFAVVAMGNDVFAPQTLVMTGDGVFGGYGTSQAFAAQTPTVAVMQEDGVVLRTAVEAFPASKSREGFAPVGALRNDCKLPRGAATDQRRSALLVACAGIDEVHLYHAGTGSLAQGMSTRWRVGAGPTGIAIDSEAGEAFVWSEWDRGLAVLPLPDEVKPQAMPDVSWRPEAQAPSTIVKLDPLPADAGQLSAAAVRGRRLFHSPNPRIAADGRACASCHPDGREDGLSWSTPAGKRQTPMLAGRLGDDLAPFGWNGDGSDITAHLTETFRRLSGTGLDDADREDLIAYCHEMDVPGQAPAAKPQLVARGRELFFSESVGCASCHKGGGGTDGVKHDVGVGTELDTPSLRYVAGTAPYYHDGRYATLESLLLGTRGKMGWAAKMPTSDVVALAEFLRTL